MFSIIARCVSSSLWGTVFLHPCFKNAEFLVSVKLYGSGMCTRLGISVQVLERNINLCCVETSHISKQNCIVHLYRWINAHHAPEYAASSNTRNQIITSEQTWQLYITQRRPGSSVGIVTDHGLDGLWSNTGGDKIFCPFRLALGPTQAPVQWVPGLSRGWGVKCGRGVLLTTHSLLVPQSWKSRAITLPTLWATPGL